MIRFPWKYRSDDDDYAPQDYSFVDSVRQGEQQRAQRPIHPQPVIRHRVDPDARIDEYGTHARRSPVAARPLAYPARGEAAVPAAAYPQEEGWSPAAPQASAGGLPPEEAPPQPEAGSPGLAPAEGPLFDTPVAPAMPEWLRVAQQNNTPESRRPPRPQVQAAPPVEEAPLTDPLGRPLRAPVRRGRAAPPKPEGAVDYQQAGYPPELLEAQRQQEEALQADAYGDPRRGAQRAVPRAYQEGSRHQGAAPRVGRVSRQEALGRPAPHGPGEAASPAPEAPPQPRSYPPPRPEAPGRQAATRRPPPQEEEGYPPYATHGYPGQLAGPWGPQGQDDAPGGYAPYPEASPGIRHRGHAPREAQEAEGRPIPWQAIALAAAGVLGVLLWVLQLAFTSRTNDILNARAAAKEAQARNHPYQYRDMIETQAQINNLHPAFIAAIVLNESSFRPEAESSVGARGLMQMMPDTYQWAHDKMGEGAANFDDMYDPALNLRYACWYMGFLSDKFWGDPVLVAAAFHAGQGTVQNWLNNSQYSSDNRTIALEDMMDGPTRSYVTKVLSAYAVYKRMYYEEEGQL